MIRRRLGDILLALLAVVTIALAAYVLLRDPSPRTDAALAAAPVPSASPSPTPAPLPPPAPVSVLLLADPGVQVGHVAAAGRALRWTLGAPLPVPPGAALGAGLAGSQLVVVQAGEDGAQDVVEAVRQVRSAAPDVRLVVVGPLGLAGQQLEQERDVLRTTAAEAGADFVDPVGSGWVAGLPTPPEDGALDLGDQQALGSKLATALRRAEQVRVTATATS